jgi:3-mercaptopyruvate sulfurtransferase SseA
MTAAEIRARATDSIEQASIVMDTRPQARFAGLTSKKPDPCTNSRAPGTENVPQQMCPTKKARGTLMPRAHGLPL